MRILRGTAVWLCGVCLCVTVWAADDATGPEFSFGAIADCQYCKVESKGRRKYSLSPEKLTRCVTHLNQLDLAFVVHLGDFIDRDFDSFSVVGPIYNQLKAPHHHVLGNHDFSVADDKKALVPATMGLADRYYAVATNGWRFIMLDGNDISFHAYPKNSAGYQAAVAYYEHLGRKAPGWNGALGPDQLAWLEAQLTTAGNENQSVALFCHFPVYPPNGHNLWNAGEVVAAISKHDCVKAYFNGHNHAGNYGVKDGIHFLTLRGMVDTETSAWAVMKVFGDRIEVDGFEREPDRVLELR